MKIDKPKLITVTGCTLALWALNTIWLARDTRPPVWDMALHQTYALNYVSGGDPSGQTQPPWEWSGTYPPFVHWVIALLFTLFHPGPHVAAFANVPATLLMFWAVYELAKALAGSSAALWSCVITLLIPYLVWMSRETILDYWLSALFVAAIVLLHKTRGFESRWASLALGGIIAAGLLTKWFFAALILLPFVWVVVQHRVWRKPEARVHAADTVLISLAVTAGWYLPNLNLLIRYFQDNAKIGALEGEPPVLSWQSLIYYVRLLEGYQFFGVLFVLLGLASFFVWKKKLLKDPGFFWMAVLGVWISMTLLRTKDPRFTMPLLAPLSVPLGAWIQSWPKSSFALTAKFALTGLLAIQVYAANFGIRRLPREVVLAPGYEGSLRWNWNLYLQHYFDILGAPRREDWKQRDILKRLAAHSSSVRRPLSVALVPDLPRFNSANFGLYARLLGIHARIGHPQSASAGIHSFDGFNYVVMTEGDQGMPWTTGAAKALNRIIVDAHDVFRLIDIYPLPNGSSVRLYEIKK